MTLAPVDRPPRIGVPEPARELVPFRQLIVPDPLCWFRLGIADRPLVTVGQHLQPGDQILERVRDPHLAELPLPRDMELPEVLTSVQRPAPDATDVRPTVRSEGPGRIIQARQGRRVRAAVGRFADAVPSPIAGTVEVVEPGSIGIRARGTGLAGVVTHGDPVTGRLMLLVPSGDAELRASAVDVQGAGAILVAGSGIDIETLTRARATGAAGIVAGGVAGKDLATLAASDVRQRVSLHPSSGFAVLVVDGYGRRSLPGAAWAWLSAADGSEVGIVVDPPMLVIGRGVEAPVLSDDVRITAGEALGLEGRLLGPAGQTRGLGGLYRAAARVAVPDRDGGGTSEMVVAFSDLERFT